MSLNQYGSFLNRNMLRTSILLVAVIQSVLSAPIEDDPVVTLSDGQIRGKTCTTNNSFSYYCFQGIPFATPPLGNLRFEAPQPPTPWSGVLDATEERKSCVTTRHWGYRDYESEDCLYINVYTPSLKPAKKLPVMFWIYGGGFTAGSSSTKIYGPDFLVEEDVIVVSSNYRIAPFGFLSTGDTVIRGNAGLKDQNLALKWTYDNIELFGGDPEKITIFGQSAGAASVSLHALSKKSAGLFRAAIIESGAAVTEWAVGRDPKTYALLLADALSADEATKSDTQKLKKFLQSISAEELINATISLPGKQASPVLEVDDEEAFISESPYGLWTSGRFHKVPIITGICSEESLMFLRDLDTAKARAQEYDANPSLLIPHDLHNNASDDDAVIKAIQNIYLGEGETFSENLKAFADLISDSQFTRGVIKQAQIASNFVPVYLYQFAYYGNRIRTPAFIEGAGKAGHSAELPYLFNAVGLSNTTTPSDVMIQDTIVKLWTNFAKSLNPTPVRSEDLSNVIWPSMDANNLQFLNINDTVEIQPNIRPSYSAWVDIYETYGR